MLVNCDLGEGFGSWSKGQDAQIMPYIDVANIACGFHAGDPLIMQKTLTLAKQHNVAIAAHPGYNDLAGFGRRSIPTQPDELTALLTYQIGALQGLAQAQQVKVTMVKPHGALYNDMMANQAIFTTVCQTIASLDPNLKLIVQALPCNKAQQEIAKQWGIYLLFEAFADRNYQSTGLLVPRQQPNALIHHNDDIIKRIHHLVQHQALLDEHDKPLTLQVDTLCIHGDNPNAAQLSQALRQVITP